MSKGLEALAKIKKHDIHKTLINKKFVMDKEWEENYQIIEKELKTLKIIKEKRVDTVAFVRCYVATDKRNEEIVKMYNEICADFYVPFSKQKKTITIEECDLLKEVLL